MDKTKVEKHFDKVAGDYDFYKNKNSFYYDNLKKLLKSLIPANKNVLEFGCGTGDLLDHLRPKRGYGYDISSEMISIAKVKYRKARNLTFSTVFPSTINNKPSNIDFIFLSDVIEHLEKPEETFKEIAKLMNNKSKLVITMANPFWEPVLMLAEKMKLKMPEGPHNRISNYQLSIFIKKSGMKITKHDYQLLVPVKIPVITNFANKYLEKLLKRFAFIEYFIVVLS